MSLTICHSVYLSLSVSLSLLPKLCTRGHSVIHQYIQSICLSLKNWFSNSAQSLPQNDSLSLLISSPPSLFSACSSLVVWKQEGAVFEQCHSCPRDNLWSFRAIRAGCFLQDLDTLPHWHSETTEQGSATFQWKVHTKFHYWKLFLSQS